MHEDDELVGLCAMNALDPALSFCVDTRAVPSV
jgi:hypothetical protein